MLDLQGRLGQLNPGGIVALELDQPGQLLGKVWWEIWPEDSRALAQQAFATAAAGKVSKFNAFCPTVQGTPRWWDVVASPVCDADGQVREVMVVSRDMTELYMARQALREANLRKDDFLATVAHELRNPLSAAHNAAELLKLKAFDHARTAELAQLVQRQLGHMSRVAEDLLDTARVGRGEIRLNLVMLDMRTVVADAVEQLQAAVQARRHRLTLDLDPAACMVKGDHTRLVQVVGNVLGNAVRYTPEGGAIAITLARAGDSITLRIADNGMGIPADRLATIFDMYSQVHQSTLRKSDGLGLGLSLVRALVSLHGGSVAAASDGVQSGSCFTIRLPAAHH
ncbi:hypothetical protein ASF61_10350 [Duganella sp. Leaf126]|nr:hypothetical protein ASF61_10350 [Duganella sp. Leaf126]